VNSEYVNFWDYDRAMVSCPSCGWTGRPGDNEGIHLDLLDVYCPECKRILLIVPFPTGAETRVAAAAGNQLARAELPHLDAIESRMRRAHRLELRATTQLPDLDGDRLVIDWDFEERDNEKWTLLRHGDREIWRELAYYEGYRRFAEVFGILRERYGPRLAEVRPTPASGIYLYGDEFSARAPAARRRPPRRRCGGGSAG
jgi:hypothetical protein